MLARHWQQCAECLLLLSIDSPADVPCFELLQINFDASEILCRHFGSGHAFSHLWLK
jgi:hypothetical protein